VALAAACGDASDRRGAADSPASGAGDPPRATSNGAAPDDPAARGAPVHALQLASFADPAAARSLRDSLAATGWAAYIAEHEADGRRVFRVRVATGADEALARLAAATLRAGGREALVVRDSAPGARAQTRVVPVNRGSHGMFARVRWAVAPDRRAMLVVEDPASVEADPVPNGFVYASAARLVRRDSVWDVEVSPDWRLLAYGRAAGVMSGRDTALTPAQWRALAGALELPEAEVRRGSFSISGMTYAFGAARPVVLDLATGAVVRELPIAAGWRVRWTTNGERLAAGRAPTTTQDDSPPAEWIFIDPRTGALLDTVRTPGRREDPSYRPPPPAGLARTSWVEGPTIDISVPVDLRSESRLTVDDGAVESGGGWIHVRRGDGVRIVGPGRALAATRDGRVIAALAPKPDAKEYEAKVQVVVYLVGAGGRE
jgi:hypothetical protein